MSPDHRLIFARIFILAGAAQFYDFRQFFCGDPNRRVLGCDFDLRGRWCDYHLLGDITTTLFLEEL
jgi:hypothetical protein